MDSELRVEIEWNLLSIKYDRLSDAGEREVYYEILDLHESIKRKNANDYRIVAKAWLKLGDHLFNAEQYVRAAKYYERAASSVHTASTNDVQGYSDDDFRKLIHHYINLSDALLQIHQLELANQAFSNAITAFQHIKEKTPFELSIEKSTNFMFVFRSEYEKIFSSTWWLEEVSYQNQERVLYGVHEQASFVNMLDGLSMDSSNPDEAAEKKIEFVPIQITVYASDADYRMSVGQYTELGIQFARQMKDREALDAFRAALKALKCVNVKNNEDHHTLARLDQLVKEVRARKEARQNPMHGLTASMAGLSVFAPPQVGNAQVPTPTSAGAMQLSTFMQQRTLGR